MQNPTAAWASMRSQLLTQWSGQLGFMGLSSKELSHKSPLFVKRRFGVARQLAGPEILLDAGEQAALIFFRCQRGHGSGS